jgi:hypothetical protein
MEFEYVAVIVVLSSCIELRVTEYLPVTESYTGVNDVEVDPTVLVNLTRSYPGFGCIVKLALSPYWPWNEPSLRFPPLIGLPPEFERVATFTIIGSKTAISGLSFVVGGKVYELEEVPDKARLLASPSYKVNFQPGDGLTVTTPVD